MDYSEDMTTSIADLRQNNNQNLGRRIENELDNYNNNSYVPDYNPDVIPQATLQKAPPMRYGQIENYPTHQTVNQNMYYPRQLPQMDYIPQQQTVIKPVSKPSGMFSGIFSGLYQRIIDPILLTILFIIFAHRIVAKGVNPYLPFVGLSPSTDLISLALRGFVLSVLYLMIRSQL